jgi:hypothetical protein
MAGIAVELIKQGYAIWWPSLRRPELCLGEDDKLLH